MERLLKFFIASALAVFVVAGVSSCTDESVEPQNIEASAARGGGVADDGVGR